MARLAGLLLLALLAHGLHTSERGEQDVSQRPSFRSDVELVQVDVVVLDESGRPVRGLTREDFTLLDRGTPQSLAAFEEISHAYALSGPASLPASFARDVADNSTPSSERLVILAVDDMAPNDRLDDIKRLAKQVVEELGHGASMAFLSTSNARQVEVTDNYAAILEQIEKISIRTATAPRVARKTAVETGRCAFDIFERAARMLAAEDRRRKAFVYISPFCQGDFKEVVRTMNESGSPDPGTQYRESAAIAMVEALRRANVAFYAIDPRGPQEYSLGHFPAPDLVSTANNRGMEAARKTFTTRSYDPVLQSQDNLRIIAEATSGFAITNTADFKAGIARLVDDFDHYYLLGFYPIDAVDKRYRPVTVRVNRPNVTLRYRHGYQLGFRGTGLPKNKDPLVGLSAGLLPRTELPLRLLATPLAPATRPGKTTRVALTVEVRSPESVSIGDDILDLKVLAADLEKVKVTRVFSLSRSVRSAGASYQIVTPIELPPGRYQLRVSARSKRLDRSGSVYLLADVPDYGKLEFALGGLLIAEPPPSSVTVMDAGILPDPPTLDREFSPRASIRVWCEILRKDTASRVETTLALVDARGERVKEVAGAGPEAILGLDGVAPGPYRLRFVAWNGTQTATRETGIVIR